MMSVGPEGKNRWRRFLILAFENGRMTALVVVVASFVVLATFVRAGL